MTDTQDKRIFSIFGAVFFLYLLIRVLGAFFLDNNWSFTHLFYTPVWYYSIPIVLSASLFYLIKTENKFIFSLLDNRIKQSALFLFFLLIFFIFQFDSFLYGGGNYKISQIAQVDTIIYRFYEFGTVFLVALFHKAFSFFDLENNAMGLYSWKLFSYIGVLLTYVASLLLSKKISDHPKNRFLIFLIIFFGPQALTYFGFVGNAPWITAAIYFFIYFGLKFEQDKSISSLAILYGIALLSAFMHISLLLLVPALLFMTFKKVFKRKNIAFIIGLKFYLLLTVALFWVTSINFEYAKYILFLKSQNMRVNYSLLSLDHLIDFIQLLLLFVPQILVVKFLFFKNVKQVLTTYRFQLIALVLLSSNTLLFIMEPTHSIILDAPMFAAYLSPMVLLLATMLVQSSRGLKYAAVFSIFVPLLVLPSYIKIDIAEQQVKNYLDKNQHFYIEGYTALQDSYFFNKEIEKANHWYITLPKISRDFLDLTAAGEFSYAKMYSEALRLYYQLKAKSPFWGQPRFQIASIQIEQNHFALARPEIDSCLMIDPYEKEYLKLDYSYYRDLGDFNKAKEKVLSTISIFPHDYDFQTDLAIIYYRLRDINKADSIASSVIAHDQSQAYAYLIRGFISEIKSQPLQSIIFFKEFIRLAPEEPETPDIRKRLNNLIIQEREK